MVNEALFSKPTLFVSFPYIMVQTSLLSGSAATRHTTRSMGHRPKATDRDSWSGGKSRSHDSKRSLGHVHPCFPHIVPWAQSSWALTHQIVMQGLPSLSRQTLLSSLLTPLHLFPVYVPHRSSALSSYASPTTTERATCRQPLAPRLQGASHCRETPVLVPQ